MRKLPLILVPLALLLAGCSAALTSGQPNSSEWLTLADGQSAGQTFVAEYNGLAGIRLMLQLQSAGSGRVRVHLRSTPQSGEDLASASLPLSAIGGPAWYSFPCEPQTASWRQSYYLLIEVDGEGSLQLGKAGPDTYLNGSLYTQGASTEGQATFQLIYARRWALLGLGREAIHWGAFLALGWFLFTLPGWGVLACLWPRWGELGWPEKLAVSTGLSLGIYPLLFLFTDALGLHLGVLYAWFPPLAGLVALLWKNRARLKTGHFTAWKLFPNPTNSTALPHLVFLILLVLLALTRFWAIRSLEAPLWGDSVQHTAITQLIGDHGGLFRSWQPYAPYGSLTVQFGFSAFSALFGWLSGLNSVKSVLITGQLLNIAAVLGLYPLATRLGRGNPWAGNGAVLVAGLVSSMPAFYLNWGRYAQLAGQAVLPAALWLVWETLDRGGRRVSLRQGIATALLSACTLAGMSLAYYRMPFYFAAFVAVLLLAWGLPEWRADGRKWGGALLALGAIAVLAGICLLPWVPRLMGGTLAASVERGATVGKAIDRLRLDYEVWKLWAEYFPPALLALSALAAAWGLLRRQWLVAALPLWVGLLAGIPALTLLRIPMTNLMENFGTLIALYVPAGLACGWLLGEGALWLARRRSGALLAGLLLMAAALGGSWNQGGLAQPDKFGMVFRPDSNALAWIRENTPGGARILVEGFRIYAGKSAVGSDAGWWIPVIARRQNSMPPQYATINEAPLVPGYTQQIVELVALLENAAPGSPQALAALCEQGITHVYIGQAQGNASASRATQLFAPADFATDPAFELVYHQDRVYLYALRPEACSQP